MRAKKTQMLLNSGCIIIEANELTTVLKDKYGNVATVDEWGKVTWKVYNIPKEGTTNEI
jgi:hypothetical protein